MVRDGVQVSSNYFKDCADHQHIKFLVTSEVSQRVSQAAAAA